MARARIPYPPCAFSICTNPACCGNHGQYKIEWPNLVGMGAEEAKNIIYRDNPLVTVVLVHINEGITDDFCCNRVWLYIDEKNHVQQVPIVG